MATAVQIELRVDEQGAVQGVRAFDTSVKASTSSVRQLNAEMQAVSTRATTSGRQAKVAVDQVGASALSSRESVRLLSEEMGVRIPRAMQSVLAKSPAVTAALKSIGTAMIGIGAIQIGAMVFEQVYEGAKKIYEKWLDAEGAIRKFNDAADEAASKKFYENAGIDELSASLREANQQLDQLNQKHATAPSWWGMLGAGGSSLVPGAGATPALGQSWFKASDANKLNASQGLSDSDRAKSLEETHKHNLQLIEDEGLKARAGVTGIASEREARRTADKEADEETSYKIAQQRLLHEITSRPSDKKPGDKDYVAPVPAPGPDAYGSENRDAKAYAQAVYEARATETARQNAHELQRIREEAIESGLRGSALYHAQEAHAIDDLKQKGIASARAVEDVKTRFHNDEMKQLQETNLAVQKMHGETLLGGLTGSARVRQEGRNRIDDVNASTTLNPGQRLAEIHDINEQVQQQLGEMNLTFANKVDQIISQGADKQLQGFARIRADADNQIRQLQQEFDKQGGDPRKLAQGIAGINSNAGGDAAELARHNADETAQIEMEARARSMSAEKQQTMAIQAEYEARLQKYNEELKQQEISQDDFNRRVVAAEELRNAQMVEAAKAAREKMAGEFSEFFKNPKEALKNLGDKAAGEAAAALVQRVQTHISGGQGQAQGTAGGGMLDSVFAKIAGAPKGTAAHMAEMQGRATAAPSMLSLSTAQIHIGSASIAFGGGSTSAASGRAPSFSGSGSTYETGTGALSGPRGTRGAYGDASGIGIAAGGNSFAGGGAGDAGFAATGETGTIGGPGAAIPPSNTLNNAVNDVGSGISFGKQAMSIFGGGSSPGSSSGATATTSSAPGDADSIPLEQMQNMPLSGLAKSPKNGGMLGGGGFMSNIGGAVSGGLGVYAAAEGNGGVGGALQGGMAGMQLGMSLAGPIGAAIGAVGGAVLGSLGLGGKEKAHVYDLRTVQPGIKNETQGYETGSVDYSTAYSDMETLDTTAERTTKQWGPAAHSYYNDTIRSEIHQAEGKFTAMEKSGRSQFTASAAQYAAGTDSVPSTGLAVIHENERIVPSDKNERITRAMESLSSPDAVARGYRSAMMGGRSQGSSTTEIHHHYHTHAIDTKSGTQWLMANKHTIRAAQNASYAENSGGADAGY